MRRPKIGADFNMRVFMVLTFATDIKRRITLEVPANQCVFSWFPIIGFFLIHSI